MRSTKGKDSCLSMSLQRLMKLIGSFSKCQGVCSNSCEVSFVTNVLVLHVTIQESFGRIWTLLSFVKEEINRLLRRSNTHPFFI